MATIGTSAATLVDWAKRLDPNGKIAKMAELLSQKNEILDDMLFLEGNLPTGHRISQRTGLPTVYWRLMNKGVPTSKSTSAQVDEQLGQLAARSQVDEDLAKLNGEVNAFRLSEATSFLEAMNQEMASTLFYGNSGTAPEEFTGLAIRYSDIGVGAPANSQNILDGGGTGSDNSSIWLVGWGENEVFGIFPKGSKAGLDHTDLGLGDAFDADNNRYRAYMDQWKWQCGLALKDWRYAVRIANIDISNLVAKSSAADLIDFMIKAIHRIPNIKGVKPAFYVNRTCFEMLDIQRRDDVVTGGGLTYSNVDGSITPTFRGIPVRICDALIETEAQVA